MDLNSITLEVSSLSSPFDRSLKHQMVSSHPTLNVQAIRLVGLSICGLAYDLILVPTKATSFNALFFARSLLRRNE